MNRGVSLFIAIIGGAVFGLLVTILVYLLFVFFEMLTAELGRRALLPVILFVFVSFYAGLELYAAARRVGK